MSKRKITLLVKEEAVICESNLASSESISFSLGSLQQIFIFLFHFSLKRSFYLMVVSWHYIIIFFLCVSYFLISFSLILRALLFFILFWISAQVNGFVFELLIFIPLLHQILVLIFCDLECNQISVHY